MVFKTNSFEASFGSEMRRDKETMIIVVKLCLCPNAEFMILDFTADMVKGLEGDYYPLSEQQSVSAPTTYCTHILEHRNLERCTCHEFFSAESAFRERGAGGRQASDTKTVLEVLSLGIAISPLGSMDRFEALDFVRRYRRKPMRQQ